MSNDNNTKSTAKEVTNLADAIFNKIHAIGTQTREGNLTLLGELGGLLERAERTPNSRSREANDLLAKAVRRAKETTRHAMSQ